MKRLFELIFGIFMVFALVANINAECKNEELNEWATKVTATFTENKSVGSESSRYAYFLSISPLRDDVKIIVIDAYGNKAEGKTYEDLKIYGVGAYTNLEEETYTIEVYGNENSACPNEKLKTLTYTVPPLNRMIKDQRCIDNPDLEICQTFTKSTQNMTEEEFDQEISKYVKESKKTTTSDIVKNIVGYGLFILVPFVIISIIYLGKIKKFKKEERNK